MIENQLLKRLGKRDGTAIVVGSIIGTGVFLKTAVMAQQTGSAALVFAAWIVAAVLSVAGALTYAELGTLFPSAGGEYVYLREAYGALPSFLYGWMTFWIASPGSIAAASVASATMIGSLVPQMAEGYRPLIAVAVLSVFTALNCLSVSFGGKFQSVLTSIKVVSIFGLIIAILLKSPSHLSEFSVASNIVPTLSGFGMAVMAALWAFDGWNNLASVGGEMRNPQKNIPFSLGVGIAIVLTVYLVTNLTYFFALPFSEILSAHSSFHPEALPVATKAAEVVFGSSAVLVLSVLFLISITGSMNGSILTHARIPYAMAQDGLFFKFLGRVSQKTHVPVFAVIVQGLWACVLALSGTFDQLTDYVIFASWIFYALVASSLFVFRGRGLAAEFKTPLYPWLPILFILCSALLVVNSIYSSTRGSLIGLAFIASGLPAYYIFRRISKSPV